MAARTNLTVTIHGSMPTQAVNPVVITVHVITRLQSIVSREALPEETVVITAGKLHAAT
ncbi:amidohydrolase [Vreelandella andesensis]|uniref:amidohydrolase n=1 Tax=Vreelandella andesensis TaxID=447567 RepID=UPI0010A9721E|nr:amidohydrolase [Halomonas andesensis]